MRIVRVIVAFALAGLVLAGCGERDEEKPVARVNGASLTADEFHASIPEQYRAVMSLEDQEEALGSWVKTELFYQEGLRQGVGDDASLRRRLREIERELVAEECIRRAMADVPEVTEDEGRAYFEEHADEYAIQIRLAHILVRSEAEADRARADISAGTPFETVAAAVSIDQTAAMGGDLGYMRRGEMVHELEEVAFGLKVGDVSGVIPSNYGYHIIKVLDRHPTAGQPSFDSKRAAVMNFLTSLRRRSAFDSWFVELEDRSAISIDTLLLRTAVQELIEEKEDYGYEESSQNDDGGSEGNEQE